MASFAASQPKRMDSNPIASLQGEEVTSQRLEQATLELSYIPDFLLDEVLYWFAPSRDAPTAVYHELTGQSAQTWQRYYLTKKGWSFLHEGSREADGPFQVAPGRTRLRLLEPGKIFTPKPLFRFEDKAPGFPIVSLEKRRPLNPWKPNYIQALNFIKKYEWPQPLPRGAQWAIWEIEECGQVAGSTSWRNAERVLEDHDSEELRRTLSDIFYNRPEDYPLGSELYLRLLGRSGNEGFQELVELSKHPVARKRKVVARTLGELYDPRGRPTLLELIEDEDPEVRTAALRAIGKVGIDLRCDPESKVAAYLKSPEVPKRVWAAQALCRGGDQSQEKFLVGLVKEEPRLLTDMGELAEVLADLKLEEAVPHLITRLKHEKSEFRADAAEALEKLTGVNLGYHAIDTDADRRNAIKTYQRWWEERKKERRRTKDQDGD